MNITRRLILQALPFIGASAAIPAVIAAPNQTVTRQERFDFHLAGLVDLINETSGPCDAWTVQAGLYADDSPKPWFRVRRIWNVPDTRNPKFLIGRGREFNPVTGEHADYDPMPDLSAWTPKVCQLPR